MTIRFITPTLHGFLDYAAAAGLIVLPLLLSLDQHSVFVYWFSIIAGVGLITYSLLTDYALSLAGVFSYKMHLFLDSVASAAFIAVAFLHDGDTVSTVYALVMGSGVIVVIALSGNHDTEAKAALKQPRNNNSMG